MQKMMKRKFKKEIKKQCRSVNEREGLLVHRLIPAFLCIFTGFAGTPKIACFEKVFTEMKTQHRQFAKT